MSHPPLEQHPIVSPPFDTLGFNKLPSKMDGFILEEIAQQQQSIHKHSDMVLIKH